MFVNLTDSKYYAGVRGTGYYVPDRVVTNEEITQYVDTTDEWIQKKIGIKERRLASPEQKVSDLAYEAALMAIEDAEITPEEIDLIILGTLCPDHKDPATACLVQSKLGAFNASAFDIGIGGCPGTVYSLNIASNFISNGACKNVLVIGAHIAATTVIDWKDRTTCCFFGDGAGAVVLSRAKKSGIKGYNMFTDGRGYGCIIAPQTSGRNFPEGHIPWNELKDDFRKKDEPFLYMDGKTVFEFATNAFPDSVKNVAEGLGISLDDIDLIIPHQANVNIIIEGMKKLKLPMEKAFVNIHKYGNTSAASVFIALAEAVREGRIQTGDTVGLASFGAGLAWGSILIEWNSKKDFT